MDVPNWLRESLARIKRQGPEAIQKFTKMVECREHGEKARLAGNSEEALEHFTRQRDMCRELEVPEHEALGSIGKILLNEGKYENALACYEQALDIARTLQDPVGIVNSQGDIGDVHFRTGKLDEALAYYQQAYELACKAGYRLGEHNVLRDMGAVFFHKGHYSKALVRYKLALKIAESLDDKHMQIANLGSIGDIHYREGKNQEALTHFRQALEIALKMPDIRGKIDNLNRIGDVLFTEGNNKKALEHYRQALTLAEETSFVHGQIVSLFNQGKVLFSEGKNNEALACFERAHAANPSYLPGQISYHGRVGKFHFSEGRHREALEHFYKGLLIARDIRDLVGEHILLSSIGETLLLEGKNNEALEKFEQALDIARSIQDHSGKTKILGSIGDHYFRIGKNSEALLRYNEALEIARKRRDVVGEINNLGRIGEVYSSEGQVRKALDYLSKAVDTARILPEPVAAMTNLGRKGDVYYRTGRHSEALKFYRQAYKLARDHGVPIGVMANLGRMGDVYDKEGYLDEALQNYRQALELARKHEIPISELNNLSRIGNVYFQKGKDDEALQNYEQSLEIAINHNEPVGQLNNLGNIGSVYLRKGDYDRALQFYRKAIEVGRGRREYASDLWGRLEFNRYVLKNYEEAVLAACAKADSLPPEENTSAQYLYLTAIAYLEESRSVEISHEIRGLIENRTNFQESSFREIHERMANIDPFPDIPEARDRTQRSFDLQSFEEMREQTAKPDPFSAPINAETSVSSTSKLREEFSTEEIFQCFAEDTAVLGYFVTEQSVYGYLLIKQDQSERLAIPPTLLGSRSEFEKTLKDFEKSIREFDKASKNQDRDHIGGWAYTQIESLTKLYALFKIDKALQEISRPDRMTLLISPDDFLHSIPFAALYDGEKHLYQKVHGIHNTMSLRSLNMQRSSPAVADLYCVFFGVPGYFRCDGDKPEFCGGYLPEVAREFREIQKIVGKNNIIAFGHNGDREYQARCKTMHHFHSLGTLFYFAGHGGSPRDSDAAGMELIDRTLSWNELQSSQWNFSHQAAVILSSCLLGQQKKVGKEMLGMVASLFGKGAISVISSLWAADDRATSLFIPELVSQLKSNLASGVYAPRCHALKGAIDFLRGCDKGRYDVPYYFAPFFISGIS